MTQSISTSVLDSTEVLKRTQGEIQACICEKIASFKQERFGKGPRAIQAHILGDFLVIRVREVLTLTEQHLIKSVPAENGRNLLKRMRNLLVETARPQLEAMILDVTGARVLSLHYDISTVTGEEVMFFTLSETPRFLEPNRK